MKFVMKINVSVFFLFCLSASPSWAAAVDCSQGAFKTYLAAAQLLQKSAIANGTVLLGCPQWQDQTLQWQAFLLAMTGEVQASQQLDSGRSAGAEKDVVLARAKTGNYRDLLKKIDDQDRRYASNSNAQLILARVLTRKGQFARGREAYQVYLKLRPDDDTATAEYLYSWIWQRDLTAAAAQFASASRWRSQAGFAEQISRGQDLINKLRGEAQTSTVVGSVSSGNVGVFETDFKIVRIDDVYFRRSVNVSYEGNFDLKLAAHDLHDTALSAVSENGNEISTGFTYGRPTGFRLAAHLGYFTLGESHYFGDASLAVPVGLGIILSGGGYRTPLALQLPLTPDALGAMRDGIFLGMKFRKYAELHLELRKEDDYAPHEWDSLNLQFPFVDNLSDVLTFRLPIQYYNQPQPNPDYDTYEITSLIGLGVGWQRLFKNGWKMNLVADYSLAFNTPRIGGSEPDQTGVFLTHGELSVPVNELLSVVVNGRFAISQDPNYLRRRGEFTGITVGLNYTESP